MLYTQVPLSAISGNKLDDNVISFISVNATPNYTSTYGYSSNQFTEDDLSEGSAEIGDGQSTYLCPLPYDKINASRSIILLEISTSSTYIPVDVIFNTKYKDSNNLYEKYTLHILHQNVNVSITKNEDAPYILKSGTMDSPLSLDLRLPSIIAIDTTELDTNNIIRIYKSHNKNNIISQNNLVLEVSVQNDEILNNDGFGVSSPVSSEYNGYFGYDSNYVAIHSIRVTPNSRSINIPPADAASTLSGQILSGNKIIRYNNNTDIFEYSSDGGITWTAVNQYDYIINEHGFIVTDNNNNFVLPE